jgi:hypothetical protein
VPDGTDPRVVEHSEALWLTPQSTLWRGEDWHLVLRLAMLREVAEREGYSTGTFNGMTSIEDRLYLSPRSRDARKIRIEPVDHVAHGQHEDDALPDWDVSDEELERLHRAGKL